MRYIAILILLSSCSANWHLKQAKKKGVNSKVDTVYQEVPVITKEYQIDTVIHSTNIHDTIRFENERVKWKTKYDTISKTVFVDVTCKPDTIKIEVPVSVTTEVKPDKYKDWQKYGLGALIATVLLLIAFAFRR